MSLLLLFTGCGPTKSIPTPPESGGGETGGKIFFGDTRAFDKKLRKIQEDKEMMEIIAIFTRLI